MPSCAEILSNIHVLRATTAAEQLAAVLALPKLLESLSNVRVVVLDSMAFHFRHTSGDFASRSRSIRAISDALRQLAAKETVAVRTPHYPRRAVDTFFAADRRHQPHDKPQRPKHGRVRHGAGVGRVMGPRLHESSAAHVARVHSHCVPGQGSREATRGVFILRDG